MRKAFLLVVLCLTIACGSSPASPSPATEDISGTWAGFDAVRNAQITMSLSENAAVVNGTWTVSDATHGGTLSGSKTNSNVSVNFLGNNSTCSLSFTGTLTSLTAMSGTIVGQTCTNNGGSSITFNKQ